MRWTCLHIFVAVLPNVLLNELTKKTVGNIHEISEHSQGDDTCVLACTIGTAQDAATSLCWKIR